MNRTYLVTKYLTYFWFEKAAFGICIIIDMCISSSTIDIESSTCPTSSAFVHDSNSSSLSLILWFLFRFWFSFSCCWPLSMFFTSLLLPIWFFRVSLISIGCWWVVYYRFSLRFLDLNMEHNQRLKTYLRVSTDGQFDYSCKHLQIISCS